MTAREIFEQILKQRGIDDVESFTQPCYEDLSDPFLMADMDKAVERIVKAKEAGETLAVYGDYDIDGMTATTILAEALSKMGFRVETFIPDRFVDGYGMTERGVDELREKGVSLLMTVDTGSLAHKHVQYAAEHGVDVIVTDHHTVGETLPEAVAVINPKRPDSQYPYIHMAGVGVAFTLIRALQTKLDGLPQGQEKWLLDLVALGTVCDVVPLTGENRILVYYGLIVMSQTNRPGLHALAQVSDIDIKDVDPRVLGWRFGPRLNASGRLTHAKASMDLLAAPSLEEARQLASTLDDMNSERRQLQQDIYSQAAEQAEAQADAPVLVLAGEGWNHGVVGIVAARLTEEMARPTFVLEIDGDITKGSARSFGDFHLAKAIDASRQHLQNGGGHAAAAGVTMSSDKLEDFRKAVNEYYASLKLNNQLEFLRAKADVTLADFSGLDDELIALMNTLEPYGTEHEEPIFQVDNVTVADWRPVGKEGTHAKVTLVDSNGLKRDAIGFGLAAKMESAGETISPVFSLEHNEWNGRKSIQHKLIDIINS